MKKIIFMAIFVLVYAFTAHAVVELELLQPSQGKTLVLGTKFRITWRGPADQGEQIVTIFLSNATHDYMVANHKKKKDGGYKWTVGQLKNGQTVQPGIYKLSLESLDGDDMGHEIALVNIPSFLKYFRAFEIVPVPGGCPMCYRIDLRKLKGKTAGLKQSYVLKLFKKNREFLSFGQFGQGQKLPGFVPVKLEKRMLQNRKAELRFDLKLYDAAGRMLHSRRVRLVLPPSGK